MRISLTQENERWSQTEDGERDALFLRSLRNAPVDKCWTWVWGGDVSLSSTTVQGVNAVQWWSQESWAWDTAWNDSTGPHKQNPRCPLWIRLLLTGQYFSNAIASSLRRAVLKSTLVWQLPLSPFPLLRIKRKSFRCLLFSFMWEVKDTQLVQHQTTLFCQVIAADKPVTWLWCCSNSLEFVDICFPCW